jgi:hypothetical protein
MAEFGFCGFKIRNPPHCRGCSAMQAEGHVPASAYRSHAVLGAQCGYREASGHRLSRPRLQDTLCLYVVVFWCLLWRCMFGSASEDGEA